MKARLPGKFDEFHSFEVFQCKPVCATIAAGIFEDTGSRHATGYGSTVKTVAMYYQSEWIVAESIPR
jgi:hypothetical protein